LAKISLLFWVGGYMRKQRWSCAFLAGLSLSVCQAGDGAISELRLGVLAHDQGVFVATKEEGLDINAELFFRDLGWFDGGWEVRPSIGASINLKGDTSQAYAGLTIGGPIAGPLFLEGAVGAAVHDGDLDIATTDRKELGCRVLFHLAASAGVMLSDSTSLSLYLDHASNANLCDHNEGLETAGARIGFRF
jgi:lipid A 3-O-deacylase